MVVAVEGVSTIDSDSDRLTDCGRFIDEDWQVRVCDSGAIVSDGE